MLTWIKASDCRIIDTWDTAGLRATGSNDIEVSDVFVPKHRTSPMPLLDPVADGALFRFPIVGLFAVGMAASALGIAAGVVIDELLRLAGTKTPFGMALTYGYDRTGRCLRGHGNGPFGARSFGRGDHTRVGDGPGGHTCNGGAARAAADRS